MKKTVVLILLIAPLVLIYVISFAGRILANYTYIYVERVVFLDEDGDEYDNNAIVRMSRNASLQLTVKVYPELAYNKGYTFVYKLDNQVFEIDDSGTITAKEYGIETLVVQTNEKSLTSRLRIVVIDTDIDSLSLNVDKLTLGVGSNFELIASITPSTASPKNIYWHTSDKTVVVVDNNGKLTAIAPGQAEITAITLNGISTSVTVTVTQELQQGVYFIDKEHSSLYPTTSGRLNLHDMTLLNVDGKDYSDLKYTIVSGNLDNKISLETDNEEVFLNFADNKRMIKIKVEVIGTSYYDEISIIYV